jgi:major membrane immunogen (membrane-anchored lipoprotein)
MGIYTAPYVLSYTVNGASIDTNLTMSPGTYNTTVEEWDNCGGASSTPVTVTVSSSGQTGVFVTKPGNNSTVTSPVNFVATATTSCSKGVASMGIYTAPFQLAYSVNGASLNTNLTLSNGTYNTTVEEWDKCGGASSTPVTITVSGSGSGGSGKTFSALQAGAGWTGYALLPPGYGICSTCKSSGPQETWSMTQHVSSPSLSGNSTKFTIGGTTDFADILYNNHLIGDFSSQGLPDTAHTLVPSLHNFTYDVYFYTTNVETSQALEFDINQFFNGVGYIWGHECRVAGGHEWDTWDNVNKKWVDTGKACNPLSNSWNHLTIVVQRTSDNQLLFQSVTLNGVTNSWNIKRPPGSAPGWYGVTVNWQYDGNKNQDPYTVYLDNLNFTYY